jgi:hypothetical protein
MTMPCERTRSLRWGHETLIEIRDRLELTDADRASAATLLDSYPAPRCVREWINAEVNCIPAQSTEAIEAAGNLFRKLWYTASCPIEVRKNLEFVLRHYPSAGEAEGWTKDVNR